MQKLLSAHVLDVLLINIKSTQSLTHAQTNLISQWMMK